MKFGKVLQQSMQMSSTSWEPHWVDYKQLKHIIKDCAHIQKEEKLQGDKLVKTKIKPSAKEDNDSIRKSPDEMKFFRTLRVEIQNIADFFVHEQAKHTSQVTAIEQLAHDLESTPTPETKTELMKRCVALYKELLLLENFAVMNFCGISKILKKHDKWTGYATRHKFMHTILMKQPFATYVPLLAMIDRLEHLFMAATGSSIEQHDAQKSAGRRWESDPNVGTPANELRPSSDSPAHPRRTTTSSTSSTGRTSPDERSASSPFVRTASDDRTESQCAARALRDLSPRSEDSVPLTQVQSLRGDAWQLKQLESVGDYDGDEDDDGDDDDGDDDGTFDVIDPPQQQQQQQQQQQARVSAPSSIADVPPRAAALSGGTHSDSDAAAIAMLSMKERLAVRATLSTSGAMSSDGGGSSSGPDGRRFKRKALAPLTSVRGSSSNGNGNGKRKMSFATILN